jgi:hypothetical protein
MDESPFTLDHKWEKIVEGKDRQLRELRRKLEQYRRPLLDILAVVHRDGGHYTVDHGLEKSVEDALKIIAEVVVNED